jgi:hypothetical protein
VKQLERKIGQQQVELDFFQKALLQVGYALITTMMPPRPQGELTVERLCRLAGVSRAGHYRQWAASSPRFRISVEGCTSTVAA